MLEKVGLRMASGKRESYTGEAKQAHDERQAEKLVKRGLMALGLTEADLLRTRKGSLEKCALAWYVHSNAMVSHEWISNRLRMGHPLGQSLYIGRIRAASGGEAARLRLRLQRA